MNNFSVCTYNVGSRVDDYFQLCRHFDPSLSFKSKEDEENFRSKYEVTQNRTAELLINKAVIYCLQEVVDEERPIIKSLRERNFEIVHFKDLPYFDTVIALDKSRFKDITNHSINVAITPYFSKDAAIATATDILSGERVTFVSAHAPGFDLTKKPNDEDTAEGDYYCQKIVQELSDIDCGAIQIIGADMNANPEKWNPRFEVFSKEGFQVYRKNSPTNVNPNDSVEQAREIDFIFTKTTSSIWQKLKSILGSSLQLDAAIRSENSIGWNVDDNASDHLPVFVDINYEIL
ncbi:MAG: hypothetical protein ACXWM7_01260 [Parachlamydiaceae bacterium]